MTYLRHLSMDGLENARDLGGYATADGGFTRYGVFLRSELPEHLSEADFALLRQYNVVRSVDLRSTMEIEMEPSDLAKAPGIEYIPLPMFDKAAAAGSASERRKEPPEGFTFPAWNVIYIRILEDQKEWAKRLMELLAEPDGCVQYNCYTGKDRTGICTAMLLSVAGVRQEDICADYSLSMAYLSRRYAHMLPRFEKSAAADNGRPELGSGFFSTLPTYMRLTLEHADSVYGGMVPYLRNCGVAEETLARIREKLVAY